MDLINRQDAIEKFECFCMEKALEDQNHPSAEARTQMSSADLISRQDAIDAIEQYGSVWMEYTDSMSREEVAERALKASKQSMIKILHDLPSAQLNTELYINGFNDGYEQCRQDAIDAIVAWTVEDRPDIEMPTDLVDRVNALPSAQQWIPCSERLPEAPSFCLVTTDGNHNDVIDIAMYMSDGWHKASKILAWMPLPEPWKGEQE